MKLNIKFCYLLICSLTLISCGYAANPSEMKHPREQVTIDFLYEACSAVGETARGEIPFFDCESYVYGVLDTYLSIQSTIPVSQRACFPEGLPPWKLLEDIRPLIKIDQGNQIAARVIIEKLSIKYSCKPVEK
jgi:hypothetical protein